MNGFKMLICGLPNAGKSYTLLNSSIPKEEMLVIHIDDKEITNPNVYWTNVVSKLNYTAEEQSHNRLGKLTDPEISPSDKNLYFDGNMVNLFRAYKRDNFGKIVVADGRKCIEPRTIYRKIQQYKQLTAKRPKYIVFDTVSKLFSDLEGIAKFKLKGFDVYNYIDSQMSVFNHYVSELTRLGINVIMISHAYYDNNRLILPASGGFKKAGGIFSQVGASIYIEGKSKVYLRSREFDNLCRFDYPIDIEDSYDISEEFDLYEQIIKPIEEHKSKIGDMQL